MQYRLMGQWLSRIGFSWLSGGVLALPLLWVNVSFAQTSPKGANHPLVLQVQQCIRQKMTTSKVPLTQDVAVQCVFSVVMLNPDGSVRPDASDRMATLLRATGVALPKPQGQGQTLVSLQSLPKQSLFTVPVSIKGQSLSFVLDTGASNTLLDNQTAQRLGIVGQALPADMLSYLVVGQQVGAQKMLLYALPPLSIGNAQVSQLSGLGLSTTGLPFKTDGLLGLDFLSRFDMILNPQTRRLQLAKATTPMASGIPLVGQFGVMIIPTVFINGQGPFRFLVDTGAAATSLSESLAQKLALNAKPDPSVVITGLGGKTPTKRSQVERLMLKNFQIINLNVLVLESKIFQTLNVEGVIGQDILNRFVQHWRFGAVGPLGAPETGSLTLSPIIRGRR